MFAGFWLLPVSGLCWFLVSVFVAGFCFIFPAVLITSVFRWGKPDKKLADNFLRACREGCGATALSSLTAMFMLIVFGGSGAE